MEERGGIFLVIRRGSKPSALLLADGAALWAHKPGQHLLHECHSAVSALCARAQNCTKKVSFSPVTWLCNSLKTEEIKQLNEHLKYHGEHWMDVEKV